MIYINKINDSFFNRKIDYVICDFDRTISTYDSDSSWDMFRKNELVSKEYKIKSDELFKLYRPFELSPNISFNIKERYMEDWTLQQFELLKEYINIELFNKIINNSSIRLRDDFKEFIDLLYDKKIPLYIVSGGIYQPILSTLKKNNCFNDLIHITSNKVIYNENKIIGISNPVIHSQNKKSIKLNLNCNDLGLLFGDLPKDIDMGYNLNTVNCAFSDEQNKGLYDDFDFVLTGDSSFTGVAKLLIKK